MEIILGRKNGGIRTGVEKAYWGKDLGRKGLGSKTLGWKTPSEEKTKGKRPGEKDRYKKDRREGRVRPGEKRLVGKYRGWRRKYRSHLASSQVNH